MAKVEFSYDQNSFPAWAAEQLTPDTMVPGGAKLDPTAFPRQDQQIITLAAGIVTAGNGKTLTLASALLYPLLAGTILDFGSGEIATLTLNAPKGATSFTNVSLAADLEGGETYLHLGFSPFRIVESGTLVGRTFAERTARFPFGVADVTTPDDELFLTASTASDLANNNDVTLLRHGTLIYEDKLPNWAGLTIGAKAAIRSRYQPILSAG